MNEEKTMPAISTDGETMTIEFQNPSDLLREGIIPFPIKRVKMSVKDVVQLNVALNFYENLIREFWCKGKLKS